MTGLGYHIGTTLETTMNRDLTALYHEAFAARQYGEEPDLTCDQNTDSLIHMLAEAEANLAAWRSVKQAITQTLADQLEGRRVRYGQTLYRSRRKTIRWISADRRSDFAEWAAEGGSDRIAKLFNANSVRFGQMRNEVWVDYDTGELVSAYKEFVHEETDDDAPWTLEAIPASRWPAYAETMPEGEVQ